MELMRHGWETTVNDDELDLAAMSRDAWRGFQLALADALDNLAPDERILVGIGADGHLPAVEIIRQDDEIRLTAASNRQLSKAWRLPKSSRRRMRALGLAKPTAEHPAYSAAYPLSHVDQVASVAITVLRDVHGIMHPALLVCDGFQWATQGTAAREMRAASAAVYPVDHDHLDRLIDEALVPLFGHVPRRDCDGDIPVVAGSTTVFIRTNEHSPMIWLFAEIEFEIDDWELLLRAVNDLNHDTQLIKFTASEGTVIASAELVAWPFAARHLIAVLSHMCEVVGETTLAGRTDERVEILMTCLQHLEQHVPLRPKHVASMCNHDTDLIRKLIQWNGQQESAWRAARDEADSDVAAMAYEHERVHTKHTIRILRKALRRTLAT